MSGPNHNGELNEPPSHEPLRVYTADGVAFVHCACSPNRHPQAAIWLRWHFKGTPEAGAAKLRAVYDAGVSR